MEDNKDKIIKKSPYSVWQNFYFIFKNVWKWDKGLFILIGISSISAVLIPFIGIFLPKLVIDELTGGVRIENLLSIIGIFTVILAVLSLASQYTTTMLFPKALSNRMKYICMVGHKTMATDYENIESPNGQTLLQKAVNALNNNSTGTEAIINGFAKIMTNIIGVGLYTGVIAVLNPIIVAFLITISAVNYIVLRYARNYEHKNKDEYTPIDKKLAYLRTKSGEFGNGKDIRLYNMSDWFMKLYEKFLEERMLWHKKIRIRYFLTNITDGFLTLLRDSAAYGYLIFMVFNGLSIADFTLYFGLITGFSIWLTNIINDINGINRSSLDICDLREYLEMKDRANSGTCKSLPAGDSLPCSIVFENVNFRYPGSEDFVLKDFNLCIGRGEKLALVGINGAGKTTFVKLLIGLYRPSSGRILINGIDIKDFNRDEYFKLFSVVFQEIKVLAFSIAQNIALCREEYIDHVRVRHCLELAGLIDKIDSLAKGTDTNLLKVIDEHGVELSGGESQKLMLARALYKNGSIIILDEPTAALDPIAEYELYKKYNELTMGKTSIFISHRLSSTRFCDNIAFIECGKVMEYGNHEDLMGKGGKYAKMFEIQSHYYKNDITGGMKYEEAIS